MFLTIDQLHHTLSQLRSALNSPSLAIIHGADVLQKISA